MICETKIAALIPARGGSKGIPRKNLALLGGQPLITYTIRAALESELISEVFVSTEDEEILALAVTSGCLGLKRPVELATDEAGASEVVRHFFAQAASDCDILVYLQPTSPFRTSLHIDACLRAMMSSGARGSVSVVELEKSPYKAFEVAMDGRMRSLFDETLSNARRQDLPKAYIPNGAIYAFQPKFFEERDGFPSNDSIAFEMNAYDSLDIDGPVDLALAEQRLREARG